LRLKKRRERGSEREGEEKRRRRIGDNGKYHLI
jgi:hypothetical protein